MNRRGAWSLNLLDPDAGVLTPLNVPAGEMGRGDLAVSRHYGGGDCRRRRAPAVADARQSEQRLLGHSAGILGHGAGSRFHIAGADHRLSFQRGAAGLCFVLRPAQSGLLRPGGRPAAPAGDEPRRPHRGSLRGPGPVSAVLDQPGLCRGGCQLRRQRGLRARLPAAAQWQLGRR